MAFTGKPDESLASREARRWPENMTKIDTITELTRYILEKWGTLEESGGSWENLSFPEYDIYPRDYLYYADKELSTYLSKHDNSALINCISHLKRGVQQIAKLTFFFMCSK